MAQTTVLVEVADVGKLAKSDRVCRSHLHVAIKKLPTCRCIPTMAVSNSMNECVEQPKTRAKR